MPDTVSSPSKEPTTTGGVSVRLPVGSEPPRSGRRWDGLLTRLLPESHRMPVTVTFLTSLLLAVGFLSLPLAGTDLSAQVARGHFFDEHGWVPIDFRWYGGVYPFGYSAFTGPANAVFGSRGVGAISVVVSAVAFAWLLAQVGARRPLTAGVLGAVTGVFNLVSGRTTFAMGIALGMLALCVVAASAHRYRPPLDDSAHWLRVLLQPRASWWEMVLAGTLAALSTAASPVAGLFVGLCGTALLLSGVVAEGLVLGIGAGIAMAVPTFVFHDGGVQPFSEESMKVCVAACLAVVLLVPRRGYQAVRIAAVLSAVGAALTYYTHNPVGSNVVRLSMLFAAPVVVAISTFDRRLLVGVVALLCWWQPPLIGGDLAYAGAREATKLYYQPLMNQLERRGPVGRVEVVPLRDHWESTYVADVVPIARGWERQVDVDRNPLFYDDTLAPDTYLSWLYENAVSYVAVPRGDTRLDPAGREEAALIEANLSYLRKEWENTDWSLYRVVGGPSVVPYPAQLESSGATGVRFSSPVATDLTVRVRWSPWLVLRGPEGCIEPDGTWVKVRLKRAGSYFLTGSFDQPWRSRC
ncbi:hypothetical protein [Cryptosporangium japonicum]|uniref:Integral membrane protein n=1 Tax=Cryptosporangium japonicum TaxID=80872 RepID=A0ABN0UB37_9ACTN